MADLELILAVNSKKIASSQRLTELLKAYLNEKDENNRQQLATQIIQLKQDLAANKSND